jgi:NitT/TauT family transport system ATP-binding protein
VRVAYGVNGSAIEAVRRLDLDIAAGEFFALLGPSGCGKSTILHIAAGLLAPSEGAVLSDGQAVTGPGIERGMVFQSHSLFPWLTIEGNVGFGPRMKGMRRAERRTLVQRALAEVKLDDFARRYPAELSIGMQQRVGLARAFANDPDILLMDEPFASLDALTRVQMQRLLLDLWRRHRKTVLFVTHDVEEALLLSDRIAVLSARPSRLLRVIDVPLGEREARPRDPRLPALKSEILGELTAHAY